MFYANVVFGAGHVLVDECAKFLDVMHDVGDIIMDQGKMVGNWIIQGRYFLVLFAMLV